jgi:hypothetical protein
MNDKSVKSEKHLFEVQLSSLLPGVSTYPKIPTSTLENLLQKTLFHIVQVVYIPALF